METINVTGKVYEVDVDWGAGGCCPYKQFDRDMAECEAVAAIEAHLISNGQPSTEDEYQSLHEAGENALHVICPTNTGHWEGATIHVKRCGERWAGEKEAGNE